MVVVFICVLWGVSDWVLCNVLNVLCLGGLIYCFVCLVCLIFCRWLCSWCLCCVVLIVGCCRVCSVCCVCCRCCVSCCWIVCEVFSFVVRVVLCCVVLNWKLLVDFWLCVIIVCRVCLCLCCVLELLVVIISIVWKFLVVVFSCCCCNVCCVCWRCWLVVCVRVFLFVGRLVWLVLNWWVWCRSVVVLVNFFCFVSVCVCSSRLFSVFLCFFSVGRLFGCRVRMCWNKGKVLLLLLFRCLVVNVLCVCVNNVLILVLVLCCVCNWWVIVLVLFCGICSLWVSVRVCVLLFRLFVCRWLCVCCSVVVLVLVRFWCVCGWLLFSVSVVW